MVGIATQQATTAAQQPTGYYVVCANGDVFNYGIFLPGSPNGLPLPARIDGVGAPLNLQAGVVINRMFATWPPLSALRSTTVVPRAGQRAQARAAPGR